VSSATEETIDDYNDFIFDNAPSDEAYTALMRVIEKDINEQNWSAAVETIDLFKIDFPDREADLNKVIEILSAEIEYLEEINLGDGINRPSKESSPISTADGNTIYFTSKSREGFDNETDDVFFSRRQGGVWTEAEKLKAPFSDPKLSESPQGVTIDGNILTLFGNYEGSLGGGDLYYSERTEFGWSDLKHYPNPINSEHFDCDAKYSSDNNIIIFTSDRPGAVGGYHKYGQ
jgi:hypothetical protein